MEELKPSELKEIVKNIVLSQGNKFIKELLRNNNIKIGNNKTDFLKNLSTGIDEGKLDQAKIDAWIDEIEGWGDQHIYLFAAPDLSKKVLLETIAASQHAALLEKPYSYEFPESLSLQMIQISEDEVTFGWKQGRDLWTRAKSKDHQKEIDGESFEFRAYREKSERKLTRFSWRFNDPYCFAYITHANERGAHDSIFDIMWTELKELGFCTKPLKKISLTKAFNNLNKKPELKVNSVKMNVDGGHINLVATAPQKGIHDIDAIRHAQLGIDGDQFTSTDGVFHFNSDNLAGLSRAIKVAGSGIDSRVRVWAQCTREDVGRLIGEIIKSL